jgi:hypothetical protein
MKGMADVRCGLGRRWRIGWQVFQVRSSWKRVDVLFNPVHMMFIHLLYPGMGYH